LVRSAPSRMTFGDLPPSSWLTRFTVGAARLATSMPARVEPVTPPNLVYVTEPFAAALALEESTEFSCEYVGQLPAAKNYGTMRMHVLRGAA